MVTKFTVHLIRCIIFRIVWMFRRSNALLLQECKQIGYRIESAFTSSAQWTQLLLLQRIDYYNQNHNHLLLHTLNEYLRVQNAEFLRVIEGLWKLGETPVTDFHVFTCILCPFGVCIKHLVIICFSASNVSNSYWMLYTFLNQTSIAYLTNGNWFTMLAFAGTHTHFTHLDLHMCSTEIWFRKNAFNANMFNIINLY